MIKRDNGQTSFYRNIYDEVIPKDHFLKKLCEAVGFSFVNAVCEGLPPVRIRAQTGTVRILGDLPISR